MSKNVLIISASPRKGGNSDTLCDQFLAGAREAGHQAEKVFLREKDIHYCTGCGLCFRQKGTCSQSDDMAELAGRLAEADVIVLATPVYFYTMDAQMKTFIDRCCAYYTSLTGKEFYFIVTAADTDVAAMERTIEGFRGFAVCLDGAVEKGIVYGVGAWEKGDIQKTPAMAAAWEMGKQV